MDTELGKDKNYTYMFKNVYLFNYFFSQIVKNKNGILNENKITIRRRPVYQLTLNLNTQKNIVLE